MGEKGHYHVPAVTGDYCLPAEVLGDSLEDVYQAKYPTLEVEVQLPDGHYERRYQVFDHEPGPVAATFHRPADCPWPDTRTVYTDQLVALGDGSGRQVIAPTPTRVPADWTPPPAPAPQEPEPVAAPVPEPPRASRPDPDAPVYAVEPPPPAPTEEV